MLFKVFLALISQSQSPAAAKLKPDNVAVEGEGEAYTEWFSTIAIPPPSIILVDKITIATIISKETGANIGEDIFLLDIPFSSSNSSKLSLTIFVVLI
jgi:hypothetical protein